MVFRPKSEMAFFVISDCIRNGLTLGFCSQKACLFFCGGGEVLSWLGVNSKRFTVRPGRVYIRTPGVGDFDISILFSFYFGKTTQLGIPRPNRDYLGTH